MESEQVLQSKNDSGGEKDVSKKKSCREKGNFFLLFTLAFLSLLPYVIPFGTPEHQGSAEEIAYENSSFFLVDTMSLERPEKASSLVLVCGAVYPPPFRFLMGLLQFPPAQRWLALIVNRGLLTQDRVEELLVSAYGRIPSPEETAGYYLPLTIKGTEITMVELAVIPEAAHCLMETHALEFNGMLLNFLRKNS